MTLGEKIIELRKKKGLTQENLAEQLNISRQTLLNWEKNNTIPDILQAKNIAKFSNISLDDLLDNNLEIECKNNSNNILQNLIGKNCYLLMHENYADAFINYNANVKILDVSDSFIKIEYKKGKEIINKIIDLDIIISIKLVEEVDK